MEIKKLYRVQHEFMEDLEVEHIEFEVDFEEGNEERLLKIFNENIAVHNRPFNKISVWDDKAFLERASIYGGTEGWDVELIYALEHEGKLFKLTELN